MWTRLELCSISCRGRGEMRWYYYRSFVGLGVARFRSWNSLFRVMECWVSRNNLVITSMHQFLLPLIKEAHIPSWLLRSSAAPDSFEISCWIWAPWITQFTGRVVFSQLPGALVLELQYILRTSTNYLLAGRQEVPPNLSFGFFSFVSYHSSMASGFSHVAI